MTNSIFDILRNPAAIAGLLAWFLAQGLKPLFNYFSAHKWDWMLIISPGGMPSSHSALMTAVTISIGMTVGWGTPLFALSLAISGVVVYDAMGVRRQAGIQAKRINKLVEEVFNKTASTEYVIENLREIIGHSPAEAVGGVAFGMTIALIVCQLMTGIPFG
ncbi:MAG: divergent PAP2 family protein [Anaerolineaceae bacterium]